MGDGADHTSGFSPVGREGSWGLLRHLPSLAGCCWGWVLKPQHLQLLSASGKGKQAAAEARSWQPEVGLLGTEGRGALADAWARLPSWPTQHPVSLVRVAWFCLQHLCVKAMDHTWPKQRAMILSLYLPVSLEDQGGLWDPVLADETQSKTALEASGKTFTFMIKGFYPFGTVPNPFFWTRCKYDLWSYSTAASLAPGVKFPEAP